MSQFRSRYTNDKTGVPYKFSDNLYRPSLRIEQVCTDNEVEAYLFQKIEEGVKMGVKHILWITLPICVEDLTKVWKPLEL